MGFDGEDAETIIALVEHHLLLAEVATRRDLDDPTTSERVAASVGSVERLHLLAALTEADSLATGPSAWGTWKADLVSRLVERVTDRLAGQPRPSGAGPFPTGEHLRRLAEGGDVIDARDDTLTVMTEDRLGVFSRVAGVLALRGLDVVSASAYSDGGRALAEFRVAGTADPVPWDRVSRDLPLALDGRLALAARLAERARTYGWRGRAAPARLTARVSFDVDASADATVIDVHAPDGIGVLYRITSALADLDLDIRSARVQTLGPTVVDAFYVRDRRGQKITEPDRLVEVERAILHALGP
jgi:[protein-PII] uridylyltransferase